MTGPNLFEFATGELSQSITARRRKPGKRMRVAVLNGDYRRRDDRGLLDLTRTIEMLRRAEALMDSALGASK
jgi:hypothetical protein